ncbi:outer membrane protein assembly factor BamB family protein, partial [Streptomyces galilaeus]|uniref:outer membrane protein assembly factor BamB family protein n=1 Tax=Streptomyces galilaeus TaxID=33899 RepID=UPI0038F63F27
IRATVDHDLVAVVDRGGHGDVVWRVDTGDTVEVSASVGPDGTTVVGSNDSRLIAVDQSGQERWETDLGSAPYSSPV